MKTSTKKKKILRICIVLGSLIVFAFLIYLSFGDSFRELLPLLRHGSQAEIEEWLSEQDPLSGMLGLFFLTVLQLLTIFFPSQIIQIAGGAVYECSTAFCVCYLGYLVGNTINYFIAGSLGHLVISSFGMEEKLNELNKKIGDHNPRITILTLYMFPAAANGLIPYAARLARISFRDFFIGMALGGIPQVFLHCASGELLVRGSYVFSVLVFLLQIALSLLVFFNRDRISAFFHKKDSPDKTV